MKSTTIALAILLTGALAHAQWQRPKADVTPIAEGDGVHAGTPVRVALRVTLPAGLHVQSDKPRDPSLIPTVLTLTPPTGVGVAEIVYPRPTEFKQAGQGQPLAVFEEAFAVGVRLAIDPALPVGDVTIPARFRYQACDASSCFAPTAETAQWTLRVVPAGTPVAATRADLFDRIWRRE